MELKQQILEILEQNRGRSVNGAWMAKKLFVTRTAIWKNIKQLQSEGYNISAAPNRGYCLEDSNDILTAESITPYLRGKAKGFHLDVRKTVGSTNTLAKEMASAGATQGTVIIANEQTEGRGRMGRSFYSPDSTGLYLSLILRPKLNLDDSLLITTTAAVAVAQAIEKLTNDDVHIKWVNDLFMNGKKVCGILTEASLNIENGGLEYAIVGIGVNVTTKDFPDDIKTVAGSIFSNSPKDIPATSVLAAEILNNLSNSMDNPSDPDYLLEYKKRSFIIGKDIYVLKGNDTHPAKAVDIDDRARLIVEYSDGNKEVLSSGEVSVRTKSD
ncbi:MAG: biotin--[acetyl-CoA-carboxylase] ligase [Anaerolineaceae bacterium]|nr:MAG: biotin--[acetyl-CoA-carboxylase] ligase [Anaerolineaceae bacterium]